ncbi:Aste57867_2425 [Aphanomyces stellatus]|uniref:Aste57867_2425 protein n=1 Tax=Aphanomyces stellatus TaxID=120398 RepID=A0A485K7I2_9STRA|nr:hypothetical protein As57867_002419 [Aphanomyces stellatus]VFT79626.1 Aste57867_2425 [Aphanomyces stellatus]
MPCDEHMPHLLPPDVLHQIASYVNDTVSFFSFLDALGSPALRGPLEAVWQLGMTLDHSSLWPHLDLSHLHDDVTLAQLQTIVPLYTTILVAGAFDLAWLKTCVHSKAQLRWDEPPLLADAATLAEWYDAFATLRVVHVTDSRCVVHPILSILTKLTHIKSLQVCAATTAHLDLLFAFAATSPSLTALQITRHFGETEEITQSMVRHIHQWFHRHHVLTFAVDSVLWARDVDAALQAQFCSTVLSHPSLDDLRLGLLDVNSLGTMPLPPLRMRTLELSRMSPASFIQ